MHIDHVTQQIYDNITNTPDLLASLNITSFTKNDVKVGIWPGESSDFLKLRNLTLSFFNFTKLNESFNDTNVVKDGRYIAQKLFNLDFSGKNHTFIFTLPF